MIWKTTKQVFATKGDNLESNKERKRKGVISDCEKFTQHKPIFYSVLSKWVLILIAQKIKKMNLQTAYMQLFLFGALRITTYLDKVWNK